MNKQPDESSDIVDDIMHLIIASKRVNTIALILQSIQSTPDTCEEFVVKLQYNTMKYVSNHPRIKHKRGTTLPCFLVLAIAYSILWSWLQHQRRTIHIVFYIYFLLIVYEGLKRPRLLLPCSLYGLNFKGLIHLQLYSTIKGDFQLQKNYQI